MAPNPTDTGKQKQKRTAQGPRPAYVMLRGERAKEFAEAIEDGNVEIVGATRKADEVLARVYGGEVDAFLRFVIK